MSIGSRNGVKPHKSFPGKPLKKLKTDLNSAANALR
jgi:hypothetical protein